MRSKSSKYTKTIPVSFRAEIAEALQRETHLSGIAMTEFIRRAVEKALRESAIQKRSTTLFDNLETELQKKNGDR